jgi:hypothetical protein
VKALFGPALPAINLAVHRSAVNRTPHVGVQSPPALSAVNRAAHYMICRLAYRLVGVKATDRRTGKSSLREPRDGSMSIVLRTVFG